MPGANYMGGKRNAAKARARDAVGRVQKGHFGRQRLEMLSRGLTSTRSSGRTSEQPPGRVGSTLGQRAGPSTISLAHAHRKPEPSSKEVDEKWFIPSPIRISPSTPRSRRYIRRKDVHTSSSSERRSEILDKLDSTEPIFVRRIMDQILAMPDLACLSSWGSSKSESEGNADGSKIDGPSERLKCSSIMGGEKEWLLEEQEQERTVPRRGFSPRRSLRSSQNHERIPLIDDSRYLHYRALPPKAHKNSLGQGSMQEDSEELKDEDFHDSGFSEGRTRSDNLSDDWSIRHHLSPTRSRLDPSFNRMNEDWDSFSRCLELDDARGMTSSPSPRYRQLEIDGPETGEETPYPDFPSCVILGPARGHRHHDRVSGMRDASSAYGKLFEREDPWATIGHILRLPDKANTFPASTSTAMSPGIADDDAKSECTNVVPEDLVEDCDALNSGPAQVADPLSDCSMEAQPMGSGALDKEACGYIGDSYDPTFIDLFEATAGSEPAKTNASRKEESLEEEIERILGLEEGAAGVDEPLGLKLEDALGRRENEPQDVWRSAVENELTRSFTGRLAAKDPGNQFDQRAKSISPLPVEESDVGISNKSHESLVDDDGPDPLAIADLREENGRFLGPSLFSDSEIDESD